MSKIKATVYLHSSKEDNRLDAQELGLSEEACNRFAYALYEVAFDLEIDTITGEYTIISVYEVGDEDNKLERKG